jgi:hypothetical protein
MNVECQFSHITGKLDVLILNCMYNMIDIRDTEVQVVMVAYYLFFILSEKIVYAAEMQILPVNIYKKFYFHFARFHLLFNFDLQVTS